MIARKRFSPARWIAIGALVVVLAFALVVGVWQLSRSRDVQLFGRIVPRVDTTEKVVALTFDDGPTPDYTPGVLDLLRSKGVRATFFLMGQDIEKHPDMARAILADGHELGNHTFTHPDMTLADVQKSAREVEATDAALRAIGYEKEILFRPPFGKKLIGLPLYLSQHDRTTVTWDVEPESYPQVAQDADLIASHVLEHVRPGSIIILHVMYRSRETSRQALPAIIDGLREDGYRLTTVSELIALEK